MEGNQDDVGSALEKRFLTACSSSHSLIQSHVLEMETILYDSEIIFGEIEK